MRQNRSKTCICDWKGSWELTNQPQRLSSKSHNSLHFYLTVVLSSWYSPMHHHPKGQLRLSEVIQLLCEMDCDKRICWWSIEEVSPEWLWRQPHRTNKILWGGYQQSKVIKQPVINGGAGVSLTRSVLSGGDDGVGDDGWGPSSWGFFFRRCHLFTYYFPHTRIPLSSRGRHPCHILLIIRFLWINISREGKKEGSFANWMSKSHQLPLVFEAFSPLTARSTRQNPTTEQPRRSSLCRTQ